MSTSMALPAAAALAAAALALPACGGSKSATPEETAPSATTQKQATPGATTTEAAPEPITAAEKRWLRQVEAYSRRLDRTVARSGAITHGTMRRSIRLYERCAPMLRAAGNPGRFGAARMIADRGCERLRKAASSSSRRSRRASPAASSTPARPPRSGFSRALSRATEATGNGAVRPPARARAHRGDRGERGVMTLLRSITGEQVVQVATIGVLIAASIAFAAYVWSWASMRKP
jgi:hypothetical protein